MLETILKYLSIITVAGAGVSFVVGLIKYLDQRAREERFKRLEFFDALMRRVSAFGQGADDGLPLTQQVAAVYELQHFKEHAFASVPILEHMQNYYTERGSSPLLLKAMEETLKVLRA